MPRTLHAQSRQPAARKKDNGVRPEAPGTAATEAGAATAADGSTANPPPAQLPRTSARSQCGRPLLCLLLPPLVPPSPTPLRPPLHRLPPAHSRSSDRLYSSHSFS